MTEADETRPTMDDVRHTHPITGETFGAVYRRGPAATDGGADPDANGRMRDVDHTPRGDADVDANDVWRRGPARDADESPDADAGRDADASVRPTEGADR